MRLIIITLTLTLAGCAQKECPSAAMEPRTWAPGRIVSLDPALDDALAEALAVWTAHWGEPPFATDPEARVEVTVQTGALPGSIAGLAVGYGHREWGDCEIYVAEDIPPYHPRLMLPVLIHEIGHCLGYDHDVDDPTSIMHPGLTGDGSSQSLKDHHRPQQPSE